MQVKALFSVLAVATALSFAGPAFAETTINGAVVSADDLPKVQARCDELAGTADNSLSGNTPCANNSDAASADATTTDTPKVNEVDNATSKIDLDTLTVEACTTAGLIK